MRTKLDDIVEEEIHNVLPGEVLITVSGNALGRIAEASFRHGVEQHHNRTCKFEHDEVQPAPAEEKLYDAGIDYKGVAWKWGNRRSGKDRRK